MRRQPSLTFAFGRFHANAAQNKHESRKWYSLGRTMLVLRNIVPSVKWLITLSLNRSPLLPRITGPGKVPPERTALKRVGE